MGQSWHGAELSWAKLDGRLELCRVLSCNSCLLPSTLMKRKRSLQICSPDLAMHGLEVGKPVINGEW